MPPLPKKRKHKEADKTPAIMHWFMENYPHSVALEIKYKKNKLLPHQQIALNEVQRGKFAYKIPDQGMRNPFDCIVLKDADAFVVTVDETGLCKAVKALSGLSFTFRI